MAKTHFRRLNAFANFMVVPRGLPHSEAGATAVEYSLLIAFVATVIIAAAGALGLQLIPSFQSVIGGF